MISYLKLELIFLISSSLCFSACVRLYCSVLNAEHTAARRRLLNLNPQYRPRLRFNTQPRGGGCLKYVLFVLDYNVSTHSRAEAAATVACMFMGFAWFQHTAARRRLLNKILHPDCGSVVSTHSRAEAAAQICCLANQLSEFQHTAARRRLPTMTTQTIQQLLTVSTHSRAEAAAATTAFAV